MRLASEPILPLCAYSAYNGIAIQEEIPLFEGFSFSVEKPGNGLLLKSEWVNVASGNYWSSSSYAPNTDNAWVVNMNNGNLNADNKSNSNYVWPVRAGEWLSIFSFENLYRSYLACRKNKRGTINALKFEINAEENLFDLAEELMSHTYKPSRSVCFVVNKPKQREIIAADFRDRIVHHLLVNELEKIWERRFIYDSYACRIGKGIHGAVERLMLFLRKGSQNGNRRLYFIHLDIKNFFMSIDKNILYSIIAKKVHNQDILWLSKTIIFHNPTLNCIIKGNRGSFKRIPPHKSLFNIKEERGLPVGNLTSQFFANLYLNELDQYVKHILKCRYYLRYCDDFIILDGSLEWLRDIREKIGEFVDKGLNLSLNERCGQVLPVSNGIDFLGYITRQDYTLVRRRVVNNLKERLDWFEERLILERDGMRITRYDYDLLERLRSVLASYFGHLKWADTYNLRSAILKRYDFLKEYFLFDPLLVPLYQYPRIFSSARSQYLYYSNRFKKMVIFLQVGYFYEFYAELKSDIKTLLGLRRIGQNRRGLKYGFKIRLEDKYTKRIVEIGVPVVIIKEIDRYIGRIKERLPVMRIEERDV